MRTIYKYELAVTDVQKVMMPMGAKLLHVEGQHVQQASDGGSRVGTFPMLWALVDNDKPVVARFIAVVGTGNPAPEPWDGAYVGSAICGPFVWHVFDGGEGKVPE